VQALNCTPSKCPVLLPGVSLRMALMNIPHPKGGVSVNPFRILHRIQTAGLRSRIRVHGLQRTLAGGVLNRRRRRGVFGKACNYMSTICLSTAMKAPCLAR
jgi:hypothetical protein